MFGIGPIHFSSDPYYPSTKLPPHCYTYALYTEKYTFPTALDILEEPAIQQAEALTPIVVTFKRTSQ